MTASQVARPRTGTRHRLATWACAALALALPAADADAMGRQPRDPAPPAAAPAPASVEARLAGTLAAISQNRLADALAEVEKVIQSYPNFRLAHLIHGDLLLARTRPLNGFGSADNLPRDQLEDLRQEARVRLARYQLERPVDRVPRYLLQLHAGQKYALVVDMSRSTLFVFENAGGTPRYLADYYVSGGKNGSAKRREGDKKTPLGVYHVTGSLPRQKLTDFYGSGAFPINYPNEWDRREGRNGHGIWLHGTPSDTYSRPPRASDGCVVLTNSDLDALAKTIQAGLTPVIIAERVDWVEPGALQATRRELLDAVEQWRRDWESLDTAAYLKHYAPGFSAGGADLAQWSQQKHKVNAGKSWIKVGVKQLSAFVYPGQEDLAVVTFEQDYASSNLAQRMQKRQYWIREQGRWRIIYEGTA